jgi:hypothetical protein
MVDAYGKHFDYIEPIDSYASESYTFCIVSVSPQEGLNHTKVVLGLLSV